MTRKAESKIIEGLKQLVASTTCEHKWRTLPRRNRLYKKLCVGRHCPRCGITEYHYGNVNT